MRIVVTGGAGFIGSHLTERLLADDHAVLCIDNFDRLYPAAVKLHNLSQVIDHPQFQLAVVDLRDVDALDDVFGDFRPDAVVHLAAAAGVRPSVIRPETYVRANAEASQNLLTSSMRCGVERIVLTSSSSVYGKDQDAPFREDSASDLPQSPYAASKRAMELLGAAHAAIHHATVTVCRPFTVFGPRQRPDLAISRFVRAMLVDRPITIYGDGSYARDFTYIDDTVEGLRSCLTARDGYRVYNLGFGRPSSVLRLLETIETVMGKKAIVRHGAEQPGDVPLTFASVERAERELGWRARVSLEDGLGRFVDWVKSAPDAYLRAGESR